MQRRSIGGSSLFLWIATGIAAAVVGVRAQQPAAEAPSQRAGEKYKNIQVLKDVPADQIEATMHFMEAATGMRCVDCHVQENGQFAFDKDDKRAKQTAREMIKIVRAVNEQFFKGEMQVSCQTCHRGANRPVGQPAFQPMLTPEQIAALAQPAPQRGQPPVGGTAGAGARAGGPGGGRNGPPAVPIDEVLNKYVDALGGRAGLEKLQSVVLAGTLTNRASQNLTFTIEETAGGKYRESVQGPPVVVHGFDGTTGWLQTGDRISTIGEFRLAEALRIAGLGLPLSIKQKYQNLRGARSPQIDGKPTIAMTGDRSRDVTETLIFDTATGLLLRRAIVTRTPVGNLAEEVDYSDYKDVAGVKLPFTILRKTWEANDTLKIVDVKPNAQIDDARFAKPQG